MAPVHSALPRDPASGISGGLGSMDTIRGNPETSSGPNLSHSDKLRLDHQPPEVSASSFVRPGMAKGALATSRESMGTATGQDPCPTSYSKGSIFSSSSIIEGLETVHREARLRMPKILRHLRPLLQPLFAPPCFYKAKSRVETIPLPTSLIQSLQPWTTECILY